MHRSHQQKAEEMVARLTEQLQATTARAESSNKMMEQKLDALIEKLQEGKDPSVAALESAQALRGETQAQAVAVDQDRRQLKATREENERLQQQLARAVEKQDEDGNRILLSARLPTKQLFCTIL